MKARSDIEGRIKYLLAEALEAQVQKATERLPHLCKHNHRHPLDTRRQVHGEPNSNYNRITVVAHQATSETMGLCMKGIEDRENDWSGTICEDPIDAQRCPYFDPIVNKTRLWQDFHDALQNPDELRAKFPEIYGLIWVLEPPVGWNVSAQLPWWKRLWFRLLRLRIEPVRCVEDNYMRLLQEATEDPKSDT